MKWKYLRMTVSLALAVAVAGCGGGSGNRGASNASTGSSKQYPEFRLGVLDWPGSVSFRTNGWIPPGMMESLVVQNLVEAGPNGEPKLALASAVEHPSPTTYIYDIRKGVRFSDGKPLTVADVVYSLEQNDGKIFDAKAAWEVVKSVIPHGSSAVMITLKRPSPDWPDIMIQASGIVEKESAEKLSEEKLGTQHGLLIGTGPWKFDSFTPEVSIQLSRNPYWSGPAQPAQNIGVTIFKSEATMALALRSGAIDAAADYESQKLFVNVPNTHQVAGAQNWITWASLKTSSPPFNDVHVRRAVAYATNVDGMIKSLYPEGGASEDPTVIPSSLFVGVGSPNAINGMLKALPKYEFNLAKAKEELSKSAYPHGFTTEAVAAAAEPILLSMAQVLAQNLAKIGITVNIKAMQNDEATYAREDSAGIFLNEYTSYVPNQPDIMMSELLSPSNIYPNGTQANWAQYKNAELGRLLPQVVGEMNPAARLGDIGAALKVAAAEEPYVPLVVHSTYMTLSNKFVSPPLSFFTTVYAPWALSVKLAR